MIQTRKPIEVVGGVIVSDGKILAAQRPYNKTLGGLWEFVGGKVEKNETHAQALKREIKEELDCDITINHKITNTVFYYDFATISLTTYFCYLNDCIPSLSEHLQLRWLTIDELDSVKWTPTGYPALAKIKKYNLKALTTFNQKDK